MNKSLLCLVASCSVTPCSVMQVRLILVLKMAMDLNAFQFLSAHFMSSRQGKVNTFQINTAVAEGEKAGVGDVKVDSVLDAIDENKTGATAKKKFLRTAVDLDALGLLSYKDENGTKYLKSNIAGEATIDGLSHWESKGTGLEADDVATLGIMSNYFFTDHVSLEIKAGVPPKVDIKGKGKIYAPLSGIAKPSGIGALVDDLPLKRYPDYRFRST